MYDKIHYNTKKKKERKRDRVIGEDNKKKKIFK